MAATASRRLWAASLVLSLSSFLFGWGMACLNSAIKKGATGSLLNDIDLSTSQQELATAFTILGAWLGCTVSGRPTEALGRKKTLLYNNVFFISGAILCYFSNMYTLFGGRFLVGLGVGVESMVVPVLLSEIAPDAERGKFTTLHQLQVTLGICASSIVGYGLVNYVSSGWKYLQLAILVPCAIQLVCASLVPESPRWLLRAGDKEEARRMLLSLRANMSDAELTSDMNSMEAEMAADTDNSPVSWGEVFKLKRAMLIGLGLMLFQPMTGINAVIFYSTTIFGFACVKEDILATISVTALNVVMTLVSVNLVDRLGRRSLLLGSAAVMTVALAVMSATLLGLNSNETAQGYLAVVSVLVYVMGFAVGLGACVWVVMGEILPTRIRSKATSLFISENWIINLVISLFTLTTIEALGGGDSDAQKKEGVAYLFIIFGGCCVGCFLFIFFNVPETKGKSLEELQTLLYGNSDVSAIDSAAHEHGKPTHGGGGSVQRDDTRALLRPVDPL